jgi:allantoin racemase
LRICVISPNTSKDFLEGQRRELGELRHVEVVGITKGPDSVECFLDDVLAAPYIVELAEEAEREKFDAVVISCFFDPGLKAAREAISIPVTSAGESSLHLACSLGERIGVVTTVTNSIPVIRHQVRGLGLENHLATVRAVSLGVLELDGGANTVNALFRETMSAITEDKADTIVLGCTGMAEAAAALQSRIRAANIDVPVVDPLRAAIQLAETLVKLKLMHSRISYPRPPSKTRTI